jgi:AraC-like DNA-binding protein
MTNFRPPDPDRPILVRTFAVTFGIGRPRDIRKLAPPRARGWNQLICASRGMLTVHAGDCAWAVPPHRAVWIPSGAACSLEMHGETELRMLYVRGRTRLPVSVVNVSPLLRELIGRAIELGALNATVPAQRRLAGVVRDELKALNAVPLQLPAPKDARARRLAALAAANQPLEAMLRECGAGRRTLERIFRDETGMSLGQWLRREKLLRGIRLLAAGRSVKEAARDLGYAHSSAFIGMFRRETGETPARYLV